MSENDVNVNEINCPATEKDYKEYFLRRLNKDPECVELLCLEEDNKKSAKLELSERIDILKICVQEHEEDPIKNRAKLITLERYKLEAKQRGAEEKWRELQAGVAVAGAASGAVGAGVNASKSCVLL